MKKLLITIFIFILLPGLSNAQITKERDAMSNAGGNFQNAALQVSWTLGEPAVSLYETPGIIVYEGIQQADKNPVGIEENAFQADVSIYPNPVDETLNFEVNYSEAADLIITLYDIRGRKIMELEPYKSALKHQGQIDFSQLAAGKWLLRLQSLSHESSKTFSIIKQ